MGEWSGEVEWSGVKYCGSSSSSIYTSQWSEVLCNGEEGGGMEGAGVVVWPVIGGPWRGLSSRLACHSTSPDQLGDLMLIWTITFECGGLWDESFPELLARACTVSPATHRVLPIR